MSDQTVTVKNAWGEVKQFGDHVSAFIVMHPKTATLIALCFGFVAGAVVF